MLKKSYLQVQVNVNPTSGGAMLENDAPEIRKYKKKFSGEILCAALWGVNLLIGTLHLGEGRVGVTEVELHAG